MFSFNLTTTGMIMNPALAGLTWICLKFVARKIEYTKFRYGFFRIKVFGLKVRQKRAI